MISFKEFLDSYNNNIHYNIEDLNAILVAIGCELNFVEGEKIRNIVSKYFSNFIIINTCSVHEKNINISKQIVERLLEERKDSKIFIVGCAVNYFINIKNNNVFFADNTNKLNEAFYSSISTTIKPSNIAEHYLGKIKIQEGCNSNCSYCIIPKLRGKSHSESYNVIKQDIQDNLNNNVFDLCLVGVNIIQYKEPTQNYGLIDLIRNILTDFPSIRSLNLDSIDPAYLNIFDLIDLIKNEPKLKKELYLATQSGSNKILKMMRRCHTKERLLEIIERANEIEIRHDFIIGFPSETDEDFIDTLQILQSTPQLTYGKENYGVISEFTDHFNDKQDVVSNKIIKERKSILELLKLNNDNFYVKDGTITIKSRIDFLNKLNIIITNDNSRKVLENFIINVSDDKCVYENPLKNVKKDIQNLLMFKEEL